MTPKQKAFKKWYESHKTCDSYTTRRRAWNVANREKIRIQQRARWKKWFQAHKEQERASRKIRGHRYLQKHRDEINRRLRCRYWSNPEKWRLYSLEWGKRNWPKIKEKRRKQYAENSLYRLKVLSFCRLREARKRQTQSEDVSQLVKLFSKIKRFRCFYCGEKLNQKQMQMEHVKPISKGGAHSAYNIVPSCVKCNQRKHTKNANEFIKTGQMVLIY